MSVSILIQECTLKTIFFYKKEVLREKHINRVSKTTSSLFSYTDVMNNMKLLAVVTPPSIYHIENILHGWRSHHNLR